MKDTITEDEWSIGLVQAKCVSDGLIIVKHDIEKWTGRLCELNYNPTVEQVAWLLLN